MSDFAQLWIVSPPTKWTNCPIWSPSGTRYWAQNGLSASLRPGNSSAFLFFRMLSFEILREKADPVLVLAWADLAGERIVEVVETETLQRCFTL